MGLFASSAGKLASHIGNRLQLAVGPIVAGAGIAWLGLTQPGDAYWRRGFHRCSCSPSAWRSRWVR
jgi:hypothetical protein